jgi:F-type H+-transporting ATPase subunit epsilon
MPIALEIVSPERLLLSRSVEMVVIPAAEGDMGVLGGHAPMILALRGGAITLYEGGKPTDRLFVAGGFAEVTPERCTVLADETIPIAEVSRSVAQQRLAEAEAAYAARVQSDRNDVPALDLAMARIQSARAMLELAGSA